MEGLKKVTQQVEERNPRTVDGKRIRKEQLQKLVEAKEKLETHIDDIHNHKPYITVKEVVPKLF